MKQAELAEGPALVNQEVLLRRIRLGWISYTVLLALAAIFYALGYLERFVLVNYVIGVAAANVVFYIAVVRGINLRFADPTMTFAQIYVAIVAGLYLMYYAQQARGVFLLLGVSAVMYGLFQMSTRAFLVLTGAVLASYAFLIALLTLTRPGEIVLQVEILQLFALGACLLQFSGLGGHITKLRARVKQKNSELEGRNRQLELAFLRIEELADKDLKITISIGIADFTRGEETSATFQRADEALYRAKQSGRNRCVVAPGTALPGEPRAD